MITLYADHETIHVAKTSVTCDNGWRVFSIHSDDADTLRDILSTMMFMPARLAATVLTAVAEAGQTGQERWVGYEPLRRKVVLAETPPDCAMVWRITPDDAEKIASKIQNA